MIRILSIILLIISINIQSSAAVKSEKTTALELQGNWIDQNGQSFSSNQFKGKTTLVTLAYTSCRTLCPMVGERVRAIDEALQKKNIKTQIVLVSIDPENETSKSLHAWMKSRRLLRDRWFFVKGGLKETQLLAGQVGQGFSEHRTPDHIGHTSLMAVIGPDGRLKSTVELMLGEPPVVLEKVTAAIAGH